MVINHKDKNGLCASILDSAMSVSPGMSGLSLGSIKSIKNDQASVRSVGNTSSRSRTGGGVNNGNNDDSSSGGPGSLAHTSMIHIFNFHAIKYQCYQKC